ncbi:cytochrome c [Algoriphagus boseongensis]|uniref:Cytochrome c n=2 Tax=Algoriphagus boseongensis TaxID=1442587 RepID=A0A4R6T680_9BACT|nr:cytochrome c [Algoriphagus boseongensis]
MIFPLLGILFVPKSFEKDLLLDQNLTSIAELDDPGLALLQKHCYTCHNPKTASHDELIAPPLFGIKNHYQKTFTSQEEIKTAMVGFILNPNEEKALLKGPVKRFGVMPKPQVSEEEIRLIVDYLVKNEVERPAWYDQHHSNGNH